MDNFKFPEPGENLSASGECDEVIDIDFNKYFNNESGNDDLNLEEIKIEDENETVVPNIIDMTNSGAESLIGVYEEDEIDTSNIDEFIMNHSVDNITQEHSKPTSDRPRTVQERIRSGPPKQENTNQIPNNIAEEAVADDDTDIVMPKKFKYIVACVIGVCLLLIIVKSLRSMDFDLSFGDSSKDKVVSVPSETRYAMEKVQHSAETYTDYIIIKKEVSISSNSFEARVYGTTTKNSISISIPLTVEQYNSFVDGQILQVAYNLVKINGETYACNTVIEGVIAE